MNEERFSPWFDEVRNELSILFPKKYFDALEHTLEAISEPISDPEDEMRTLNRLGRHILDATSTAEMISAKLKRRHAILSSALARQARGDLASKGVKGRPTKEEVEGFILSSNQQYTTLVGRIDAVEVLLAHLRGDGYGKGGAKEQVRFRRDFTVELSVRERQGVEDERTVD